MVSLAGWLTLRVTTVSSLFPFAIGVSQSRKKTNGASAPTSALVDFGRCERVRLRRVAAAVVGCWLCWSVPHRFASPRRRGRSSSCPVPAVHSNSTYGPRLSADVTGPNGEDADDNGGPMRLCALEWLFSRQRVGVRRTEPGMRSRLRRNGKEKYIDVKKKGDGERAEMKGRRE